MAQPYLSIVVPAYNEAEQIPRTLIDIDRRLANAPYSYEIIVVNDGSLDRTAEVVQKMKQAVRNLKLIDNAENKGRGGAVRQGMLIAGGVVRLSMDADNSTSVDQFEKMIPLFKEGYGVVAGSRAAKGARLDPRGPFVRLLVDRALNLLVRLIVLPGVKDTRCGFKAFTAEVAGRVFERTRFSGWGFDVEALALARRMGYRMAEVPVRWTGGDRTRIGLPAGFQFLGDLAKLRWRLSRHAYGPLDMAERPAA